ncbi:MAG: hypothetical protein K2Q06_02640, partial [Parvularculaceae bacterium]|nr:hypothetical protein [Parvularculaceae bacterium]
MSPAVALGLTGLSLLLFLAAGAFAMQGMRAASSSRMARAEADAKLDAARDLASEVKNLRSQVEEAVLHHNS